jgi:hypothetical protein
MFLLHKIAGKKLFVHSSCVSVKCRRLIAHLKARLVMHNFHLCTCHSSSNPTKQQKVSHDKEVKKVNNFKPSDLSYQGAHLFSTFRRFHLKEQQRFIKDALDCNLVSKLDKGEKIDPQNLKIYKHLSADDLASGPDWLLALVLLLDEDAQ